VTPEDVAALSAPGAAGLLRDATQAYAGNAPDALQLAERLRSGGHDAQLVALALTQGRLRRRVADRLGPRGARLLWTPESAEQATRAEVSAHRVGRLVDRLAAAARVADLGCGAGADALAMADAGLAVDAYEYDPATAAVAATNVALEGYEQRITVRRADVTSLDLRELQCDAAYVDPARRSGANRRFDPEGWSPPWSWVQRLAEQVPATVAKVAPGIPHDLLPAGAEGEWVSWQGDLKEATVWNAPLATARRRATLLPSRATVTDAQLPDAVPVGSVGRWLVEPDDAVIRAGLVAAVVAAVSGRLLDEHIAYVVADEQPSTPLGTTYEVLEELPFALKRMRSALRSRGFGDVVVKKRGVAVLPEEVRRRLGLSGQGPTATVVLTRRHSGPLALLVTRSDRTVAPV
jgi:hypothetical protein